jgi:hypothetical protein
MRFRDKKWFLRSPDCSGTFAYPFAKVYVLSSPPYPYAIQKEAHALLSTNPNSSVIWHQRLEHVGLWGLRWTVDGPEVSPRYSSIEEFTFCDTRVLSKQKAFSSSSVSATREKSVLLLVLWCVRSNWCELPAWEQELGHFHLYLKLGSAELLF